MDAAASISTEEFGLRLAKGNVTRVLVVDDEPALRRTVARMLIASGYEVITAEDGGQAKELLARERVDIALVDLMMPRVNGMELLEHIKRSAADIEVVMMTAFGDVETALKAVRAGAYDYLTKPFRSNEEVLLAVGQAAERRQLLDRTALLERKLEQKAAFGDLIGNSAQMREVYRLAMGVAPTGSTVLILGESGTGKELTARAIHEHSQVATKPFVAVNCSAIPVDLVESELFGHVRGAFTGATANREGLFEAANGGTIFLDEVGDLPPLAQVKLLRVLQQGEIKSVGSNQTRRVDVRVIAATNVDLRTKISAGQFREDLFYRLNVIAIELPPLRKRRDDIPLLAHHFLKKHADDGKRFSPEAMRLLRAQRWSGNVRELENVIEYAVVFCRDDVIGPGDFPFGRGSSSPPESALIDGESSVALPGSVMDLPYRDAKQMAVSAFDALYFSALLDRTAGNISEAARQAGLDRSNFRRAARRAGVASRD